MRIFLATPITAVQRRSDPKEWEAYCHEIRVLLGILREYAKGEVFCALEQEDWGTHLFVADEAARRDFLEIKKADILVCYYEPEVVSSVLVEIGWASCLGKKIVVCARKDLSLPTLVEGVEAVTKAVTVRFQSVSELIETLPGALARVQV